MGLPFYNSAMIYDMINADSISNIRLNWNCAMDNVIAQNGFYQVPIFNSCNMYYGNPGIDMFGLNPFSFAQQFANQCPMGGNTWNSSMIYSNNIAPSLGYQPTTWHTGMHPSSTSSSSSSSNSTENKKYNRLYNLVRALKDFEGLSSTDSDKLADAIKEAGKEKDADKKYNILHSAYKEIDLEIRKKFLVENGSSLVLSDKKKVSEDNISKRLFDIGYEFNGKYGADNHLTSFYDGIDSLKDADRNDSTTAGKIDLIKSGEIEILDFVSSWNSKYKKGENAVGVIQHIAAKYDKIEDSDGKKDLKSIFVSPLVDAMVSEAGAAKKSLSKDEQKALEEAITELENSLKDIKPENNTSDFEALSNAFDNAYLLTRMAKLKTLQNDAKNYYGEIDNELFDNKLFLNETIEDLESEGFAPEAVSDAEKLIFGTSSSNGADSSSRTGSSSRTSSSGGSGSSTLIEKSNSKKDEMIADGMSLDTQLSGWIWDDESAISINDTLNKVNKNNVISLLTGYYTNANKLGATEGLIERLDDEWDSGKIEMKNKKKLINSLLDVAEKHDLKDNTNYIKIKSIMNKYKSGHTYEEATTFNHGGWARNFGAEGFWTIFKTWIYPAGLLDNRTDNEVLDECIEKLFQEIRAKQAQTGA